MGKFDSDSVAYLDWEIDIVFSTKGFAIIHTINHYEAGGDGDRAYNNYFQDFRPAAQYKSREKKGIIVMTGTIRAFSFFEYRRRKTLI